MNPNIFGVELDYPLRLDQTLFAGKDYVILRQEFRENKTGYTINEKLQNILITVGGSDIRHLIPALLDILPNHYNVKVVAGKETYKKDLRKKYPASNIEFDGFVDANRMKALMVWSDLCISASGQTLHELAFLGIPTIGICIDIDQIPNTKQYASCGVLQGELMWNDANFKQQILVALEHYQDQSIREQKSLLGKQFIDGKGVDNIVSLIISL